LSLSADDRTITAAVLATARGEAFADAGALRATAQTAAPAVLHDRDLPETTLTSREQDVTVLIRDRHLSNPEIAKELNISENTVEHHVSSILRKLSLRSRYQL
jgi:DNA-binding NarL/FixJ family response regulator